MPRFGGVFLLVTESYPHDELDTLFLTSCYNDCTNTGRYCL